MVGEGARDRQVQRGRTEAALEIMEWMVGWKVERAEWRVVRVLVLVLVLVLLGWGSLGVCECWVLLFLE